MEKIKQDAWKHLAEKLNYYIEKAYTNGYIITKNPYSLIFQWRRKYIRTMLYKVPTLTANMGTGGHNIPIIKDTKGFRKLTPRECFNLQAFPKDFKLPDIADCHLYKQEGNSVTVSVIKYLAELIK